jgi:membrane protease YdiL (CAAX protease family)
MRAAVISAVLFGLMHLVNLFIRSNPAIVLAQCVGAFVDGVGFAALRIRTKTIWPLVLLHMLHDLLLQYTRLPAIPLDVAQVTILMFYGFYLMRQPKKGSMGVSPA